MSSTPNPSPAPLPDRLQSLAEQLRQFAARPKFSPSDEPGHGTAETNSPDPDSDSAERQPTLPLRIGDYELLDTIAVSGKTILYRARQVGLDRVVAVRTLVRDAHLSPDDVRFFHAAAESAAKLDHPGIVPIFEMGRHKGLPFYSMPFFGAGSLAELIVRRGPLNVHDAALLVRNIALALDYAHQCQVVHNCLTPYSVLLDEADRVPNTSATDSCRHSRLLPRISNFGLAWLYVASETQMQSQQVSGPLPYAPTSQVHGHSCISDTSVDVYSLGVILYYAITGYPPIRKSQPWEHLRTVLEKQVFFQSHIIYSFPREIESVVSQCMGWKRGHRFTSALEVANELDRFLERHSHLSQPINVPGRKFQLLIRRSSKINIVACALVIASIILGVYRYFGTLACDVTRNEPTGQQGLELSLNISQLGQSQLELQAEDLSRALILLDSGSSALRNWEWAYLRQLAQSEVLLHQGGIDSVRIASHSPNGRQIATLDKDSRVRLWDVSSGKETAKWNCDAPLTSMAWSSNGRDLIMRRLDGRVSIFDNVSGNFQSLSLIHQIKTIDAAFHPDGSRICIGDTDGVVRILQAFDGELISTLPTVGGPVCGIAIDPAGRLLATANASGSSSVWEIASEQQIQFLSQSASAARRIVFASGGRQLIGAGDDGICRVWDVESGEVVFSFKRHDASVGALEVSSDGEWAVSGSDDGVVCVWETDSGELVRRWRAHDGPVSSVSIRPGGRELLTCSIGEPLKVWKIDATAATRRSDSHSQRVHELAFSPDGGRVASASVDGSVRVWDTGSLERERALVGHQGAVLAVAFGTDGRWLVSTGEDGTIRRWDARSGRPLGEPVRGGTPLHSVAVPRRNMPVACGGADGSVSLWDVVGARRLRSFAAHAGAVRGVRFSPDDRLLASCGDDGAVRLWNVDSQTVWKSLGQHAGAAWHVAFSPDGDRLASTGDDGVAIVWELASGRPLFTCAGHAGPVLGAAFSPDGSRLVTAGHDQTLKVWELASGREVLTLTGHHGPVESTLFSPDGLTVASAGADGHVRLWRAGPW